MRRIFSNILFVIAMVAPAIGQELPDSIGSDSIFVSFPMHSMNSDGVSDAAYPSVIPQSPTVAALCKYGETPVSYACGIPEISIPLYTIKCGSLELPITLNYHAGGIKVDETASWVGLGGSLSAGGVIGSNPQGKHHSLKQSNYCLPTYDNVRFGILGTIQTTGDLSPILSDIEGGETYQPDIMTYNVAGYAGKMVYDSSERKFYNFRNDKSILFSPSDDNNYVTAKDQFGNNYVFDQNERAIIVGYRMSDNFEFISARHLSSITSFDKCDTINIEYSASTTEFDYVRRYTPKLFLANENAWRNGRYRPNIHNDYMLGDSENYIAENIYHNKYVSRISANNGVQVVFDLESDTRLDMAGLGCAKLNKITIYNKNNQQIKKWEFNYDYFDSSVNRAENDSSFLNYRLKLLSIVEYGSENSASEPLTYSFDYYGDLPAEKKMPFRTATCGKDLWGYCNGEPDNVSMANDYRNGFTNVDNFYFRRLYFFTPNTNDLGIDSISYISSTDKTANIEYAKAYSLKRVNYPAGGYQEYVYELNQYKAIDNYSSSLEIFREIHASGNGLRIKEIRTNNGEQETCDTRSFVYSEGELLNHPQFISRKVHQEQVPINGSIGERFYSYLELSAEPINTISMPDGNLIVYDTVQEHFYGGYHEYRYSTFDRLSETLPSNGSFFGFYSRLFFIGAFGFISEVYDCPALHLGSYVQRVNTIVGVDVFSGRNAFWKGYNGSFYNRGLLLGTSTYNTNGQILNNVANEYTNKDIRHITCLEVLPIPTLNIITSSGENCAYLLNFYFHTVGQSQLVKSTNTDYYYDSQNIRREVTTTTRYRYNEDNLLCEQTTCNTCGDSITQKIYYPRDVNSSLYTNMVARNMINYPVERITYRNGVVAASDLTEYGTFGTNYYPKASYKYRPSTASSSFARYNGTVGSHYSNADYTIEGYEHGRIKNIKIKTGQKYTYFWDESYEYPTAEILGTSYYSTIAAARQAKTLIREFTYKPQVGMTSEKTPFGLTWQYDYDSKGRLEYVKIKEADSNVSNVMEKYSYELSPDKNYIQTQTWLNSSGANKVTSRDYYDGLNRFTERMQGGLNTSGNYVASFVTYDGKGREKDRWLPVVAGASLQEQGHTQLQIASLAISTYSDNHAFSTTSYDATDRAVGTTSAGDIWQLANKHKKAEFGTNLAGSVKRYTAPNSGSGISQNGYHLPNTLHSEKITDEDGKTMEVFTDFSGLKILERRAGNNDTYYVYNELGQLRFVLSPEYQNSTDNDKLKKFGYEYQYNSRGHIERERLPGCEYAQYWYDAGDRLSNFYDKRLQDAGLRRIVLYDRLGREVLRFLSPLIPAILPLGIILSGPPYLNASQNIGGYEIPSESTFVNPQPEHVNYYDNYQFLNYIGTKYGTDIRNALVCSTQNNATGMLTGTIRFSSDGNPLFEAYYYDKKGNITDTKVVGLNGRVGSTHNTYSYTGKLTSSETSISVGTNTYRMLQTNTYDAGSDLLTKVSLTPKRNNQTFASHEIKNINYDNLGHVSSVSRPGNAGTVSYQYELHGWLKSINSGKFNEYLDYGGVGWASNYNGNISHIYWNNDSSSSSYYAYRFLYDSLNRLSMAQYGTGTSPSNSFNSTNRYNEQIWYDANGNATKLSRRGLITTGNRHGIVDSLTFVLDGNRLVSVTDHVAAVNLNGSFNFMDGASSSLEYTYDGTGSLTSDLNKGITSILYDNLGYPKEVNFSGGNQTAYIYSSDGARLRTQHLTGVNQIVIPLSYLASITPSVPTVEDETEYFGNWVIENSNAIKFMFDGGYVSFTDSSTPSFSFHYFTQDHLGNNRVVMKEDGTVEQITNYYALGGIIDKLSTNQDVQRFKYNGKELDRMHGLDWYDYGARNYDAILGRWDRMDPLCEKYYHISPYAYCAGNPVNRIDADGRIIIFINGMHMGSGGSSAYWSGMDKIISKRIEDYNTKYYDGSLGGVENTVSYLATGISCYDDNIKDYMYSMSNLSSSVRTNAGYEAATRDAASIYKALEKETIKIVSHSMGGAFAKGFVRGLINYANENNLPNNIDYELDFAPFQPEEQSVVEGVKTIQFSHYDDIVAGHSNIKNIDNNRKQIGYFNNFFINNILYNLNIKPLYDFLIYPHSIDSFIEDFEKWKKGN